MPPVFIPRPVRPHEVVVAFEQIGWPLSKVLCAMLNEAPEHRRPRRGCGFTQATRLIAGMVNERQVSPPFWTGAPFSRQKRRDLKTLGRHAKLSLGREPRGIQEILDAIALDRSFASELQSQVNGLARIGRLHECMDREESRLLVKTIASLLLGAQHDRESCSLPLHPEKLPIGTCPEAERFFLELAAGHLRRQGLMNVIVDDQETPILVEKMNMGDPHSSVAIRPVRLNGVWLPAGSLIGTWYSHLPITTPRCREMAGAWIPLSACDGFRFLRVTTLAVSPKNRARAFTKHLERQLDGSGFFDPLRTEIEDLRRVAELQRPISVRLAGGCP